MTLTQCFSVLAASGQGYRLPKLKEALYENLLVQDSCTNLSRVEIFKAGKDHPSFIRISSGLTNDLHRLFQGIDPRFFGGTK